MEVCYNISDCRYVREVITTKSPLSSLEASSVSLAFIDTMSVSITLSGGKKTAGFPKRSFLSGYK